MIKTVELNKKGNELVTYPTASINDNEFDYGTSCQMD
jgi:hypothetical protein